ncbi:NAD(P)/FAD-dependent oxidoreductase [Fodinicurvata sediminis]|uniref:NAD(P)/FAD-dependent oxidoreductase n=1 Tax=Fodinicurvata sediminis TaxID=1121832 RepID=UPI000427BD9A|nr:FAD-dependent oxidoreductase [Fodinicurvata sediminis]
MAEASDLPSACDVAVVGGGPAGLAAATELKRQGVARVLVLDREPAAGGIPRHCGHYPFGMREFRKVLRGPDYAGRLVTRAAQAGAEIHTGVTVTRIQPGGRLSLTSPEGTKELQAKRVLLCTGVRETSRAARLIGGERPLGVLPTGALQSLVYLEQMKPFERPVILGSELVSFSALMTCRHAGIEPQAMIEPNQRITARNPARGLPFLLGVPLHLGCEIEGIIGEKRVEAVQLRNRDGRQWELPCDGVLMTGRFTPEATLARMGHLELDRGTGGPRVDQYGRSSDPDIFVAGNLLRPVETAGWSWKEGLQVARCLARDLEAPQEREGTLELRAEGEAIRYLMPQQVTLPLQDTAFQDIQVRVDRPARGSLLIRSAGRILWGRRLSALPERRILVPLDVLANAAPDCPVEVVFEEENGL